MHVFCVCQKPVKAVLKARKLCLMCCEEEGSVTLRPCGHVFCSGTNVTLHLF